MAIDQYDLCPCGSGKKVKFCKCADNIQEMQKVERMISGEQYVAALDRINALLKTYPSDAWLHAYKCEVLLQLDEREGLEEASAKFIRLRPDNPLARVVRSMVAIMRGNIEESASFTLQALADQTIANHRLFFTNYITLLQALQYRGFYLSCLLHAEILIDLHESISPQFIRLYDALVRAGNVSILFRESLPTERDEGHHPWSERYREAIALLDRFQFAQAKTKLEAIQREFGNQPPILSSLLHCRLLFADNEGAAAVCQQLADINDFPDYKRIYYQALAFQLDAGSFGAVFAGELIEVEVADEAQLRERLNECNYVATLDDADPKEYFRHETGDEVLPREVFSCRKPVPVPETPIVVFFHAGLGCLFGKQTDKPARLVLEFITKSPRGFIRDKVLAELGLTDAPSRVIGRRKSYFSLIASEPTRANLRTATRDAYKLIQSVIFDAIKEEIFEARLPVFGEKPLKEAASDPQNHIKVAALLLAAEAENPINLSDEDFANIHEELGITRPQLDPTQDVFDLVGGAAYYWTMFADANPPTLLQMMQAALYRSATTVFKRLVAISESTEWPDDLKDSAEFTTLHLAMNCGELFDYEELDAKLLRLCEVTRRLNLPVGKFILQRFDLLLQAGRANEARAYLMKEIQANPEDPDLREFIQMSMMEQYRQQQESGAPDLMSRALARHSFESHEPEQPHSSPAGSGLWTPDQPTQPVSAAPSETESGSKLWLPGQ